MLVLMVYLSGFILINFRQSDIMFYNIDFDFVIVIVIENQMIYHLHGLITVIFELVNRVLFNFRLQEFSLCYIIIPGW